MPGVTGVPGVPGVPYYIVIIYIFVSSLDAFVYTCAMLNQRVWSFCSSSQLSGLLP